MSASVTHAGTTDLQALLPHVIIFKLKARTTYINASLCVVVLGFQKPELVRGQSYSSNATKGQKGQEEGP
jgi:hypothetical protein